ncbi:putative membrane protein SpoIIM required for sporulation [Anseongella ginsenosidimutans]|uniref:Putative membrane protein SpoIIM required for sporulation n=1 Tax=Anseongella ginsenosidimutans TaxID=496056 RepID=A0A4R3KVM4_9SPHI|nr:stage II sporulation protein M [Anseongella ginsenosidimutans]QEC51800.1 stage II sporulation protein M [Anseongella ginsenosidimutans]TCS89171.1 putative membrane protein SpoIIM required for sporulation [Anseongella ginsenosidimutans]
MREAVFVKHNAGKWKAFEDIQGTAADELARNFIELTDDLSYARTFYPGSETVRYLNGIASRYHLLIYRNKRENRNRFLKFWTRELPIELAASRRYLLYSFLIFLLASCFGVFSTAQDESFVRLILGDRYVNMTLENIEKGDPMAVYKSMDQAEMFLFITFNNIKVSFLAFVAGALFSFGTVWILFRNGIMLGAFQYFFYQKGLLTSSVLTIWIHGTLEISAIIIAGAAGMVMGNSLLFPGTWSRLESFKRGARRGLKIVIGLVPVFIVAGFLEGFVTRHTGMPMWLSIGIITCSAAFILYYFVIYPIKLRTSFANGKDQPEGRTGFRPED